MGISTADKMLIEQRIQNDSKSPAVAYLLLIFLGPLGAHRFYLGRTGTGIVMLILSITVIGLIVSGIWAIVDFFLVQGMVQTERDKLRQRLTTEALVNTARPDFGHDPVLRAEDPMPRLSAPAE